MSAPIEQARPARPFITDFENDAADHPATLVFNPNATTAGLLLMALSRTNRLRTHLNLWACVDSEDKQTVMLASVLDPLAQEVELILAAMVARGDAG